jgi:hypothetical protein
VAAQFGGVVDTHHHHQQHVHAHEQTHASHAHSVVPSGKISSVAKQFEKQDVHQSSHVSHAATASTGKISSMSHRFNTIDADTHVEPSVVKASTIHRSQTLDSHATQPTNACPLCQKTVYFMEQIEVEGKKYHKSSVYPILFCPFNSAGASSARSARSPWQHPSTRRPMARFTASRTLRSCSGSRLVSYMPLSQLIHMTGQL